MKDQCHDVFYFNASVSSGSQLINSLQENGLAKVIIIENMDKLRKNYLSSLHRLVDNGCIRQVQFRDFKMDNIKVFATVESLDKLTPQLRSRFMAYRIL